MLKRIGSNLLGAVVLLAAGGVSLAPSSASAERVIGDVPAVTVRYGDLDLNSAAGVAALYARIERAARTACGHNGGRLSARETSARRACYREVLATAVGNTKLAALDAVYRSASGRKRTS